MNHRSTLVTTLAVALLVATLAPAPGRPSEDALRVRASASTTPCLAAVVRFWEARGGRRVEVETGGLRDQGPWDVLVGSSVELTRALEGGDADVASDVEVATIPWVLHLQGGGDVAALSDVVGSGVDVVLPAGDESYEARRTLAEQGASRVLETRDTARLRSAPAALVPLSLAGPGKKLSVDVPPIRVGAAVGLRARHGADAGSFVALLGSKEGRQVFSACSAQ